MTVLVVVVLWGALLVWLVHRAKQDADEALTTFSRAAARLRFSREGAVARGQLDAEIELVLLETLQTRITASLRPALALGLSIRPRPSALLAPDTRLNPGFDAAFVLDARDHVRALDLLRGEIERLLVRAEAAGLEASVDDDSVILSTRRLASLDETVAAARAANDLAVHLVSRRPLLRAAPEERAVARALQSVGKSLGASVDLARGRLELGFRAGQLLLSVERTPRGKHALRLLWRFARPLPAGIALSDERQRSELARLLDPDIETDDAELDAALVVRGRSVEEVKALLDVETRGALLRLWRSVHTLHVDEAGIDAWMPVVPADARKLAAIVEATRDAAEALSRHGDEPAYR